MARTGLCSGLTIGITALMMTMSSSASAQRAPERSVEQVPSKDGTPIAVECAGDGPNLLIVHGGTGDRTRWTPLFPLLAPRFRVCAMDRRAHGASGDSAEYSLRKEAEDVAAVVDSRPGPVFVLGHSFGAVCAFEAAFLTNKIGRLVLYEPPLLNPDNAASLARMANMIESGDRDGATTTFQREVVMNSTGEIAAMKSRPSWPGLVATIETSIRQDRALSAYRFDPVRAASMSMPTLLLIGSDTTSPSIKMAIARLMDSLPNRRLFVFEGQQHNAMDAIPQQFAAAVVDFLAGAKH